MPSSEQRAATMQKLDMHCEVCRGAAVAMVQDFVRRSAPGTFEVEYQRDGKLHVFCEVHNRPSRVREVWVPDLG